ncbi:MAG TPA: CPBP family intramembrane glutamic endopeptidase [Flavisolibacter sp.]|nr:CPBP family intramembrane glutamic endopeptidase [Flavisolibacter sp.]
MQPNKVNWLSVITYYVLACAISWPFFWWRDMNGASWAQWAVPNFIKTWSYMWGPGMAAIICFFLFRKSLKRTITFFGSSVLKSLAFYSIPILGLAAVGIDGQGMNAHLYPLVFGLLGFISILGEELGWRGFLQDALRPLSPLARYALIGVMWELWHFTNRMGHGELLQVVIRVSVWVVALCIVSFIIGSATDRSKSVVVAVTLHAWIDILAEFNQTATYVVFGLSIPFWMYLLWKWGGESNSQYGIAASERKSVATVIE